MRTIINIETEKLEAMKIFCQLYNISRAELIRKSIDLFLETHTLPNHKAFGLLKNQPYIDGLEYQKKLRGEWDGES